MTGRWYGDRFWVATDEWHQMQAEKMRRQQEAIEAVLQHFRAMKQLNREERGREE